MKWTVVCTALLVLFAARVSGQQRADSTFSFSNPQPSFESGSGPTICIDEAHNNFHTVDGRYKPFADLLRTDGFKVVGSARTFEPEVLSDCAVMVVANAIGTANANDWAYPHPSAFDKQEIIDLIQWIRGGGSLLLFVDHSPMPGSAGDLGLLLGLDMFDGYVSANPGQPLPDIFSSDQGTLKDHAILSGREVDPVIQQVGTFTGQAFRLSDGWRMLLQLPETATGRVPSNQTIADLPRSEWPTFPVGGWSQGAARQWSDGRIVAMGEAAMCSAQNSARGGKMGMNHPNVQQNPLFCLNLVRWLTRVIVAAD